MSVLSGGEVGAISVKNVWTAVGVLLGGETEGKRGRRQHTSQ